MFWEENFIVALNGLLEHKLRSFLTMLGIIFGVASVIAMLSIGEGAKRQAIAKYQDLGVNNIIIRDRNLSDQELQRVRAGFSPGLSMNDANSISEVVPMIETVAPQTEKKVDARYEDKSIKSTLIGVTPDYNDVLKIAINKGSFITQDDYDRNLRICIIGASVAETLFQYEDAIGKLVKVDSEWFEVRGVLGSKSLFTETVGELASRDLNTDIYIPLSTFSKRIEPARPLDSELKQITVKVENSNKLLEISEVIENLINRRHHNNDDYSIIVPYELMKQEEKERRIYNVLLGSIAAISLVVGGIGIMNIMLASVMERTREIGVRRAIGARQKDIMSQFITEAVVLSITGGLIGVFLGVVLSFTISIITDVTTSITLYSVFIAFFFSVIVGINFGYLPAKKAAALRPIESIRYE